MVYLNCLIGFRNRYNYIRLGFEEVNYLISIKNINMKKKLLPIVFLFAILAMNAQITFQKTYGGPNDDKGYYAQQTSDGGYVLAGYASDFISGSKRPLPSKMFTS